MGGQRLELFQKIIRFRNSGLPHLKAGLIMAILYLSCISVTIHIFEKIHPGVGVERKIIFRGMALM